MNIRQISNWSIVGLASLITYVVVFYQSPKVSPEVPWGQYSSQVRIRIHEFVQNGDCKSLQKEHDVAWANDGPQRSRTGVGNSRLMGYISFNLEKSGCYDG